MKKTLIIFVSFVSVLGLVYVLHAQVATSAPSASPDSIVQLTADAQGLMLLPPNALPKSGTFWLMLPNGFSAPYPMPPPGLMPTYSLGVGGQFLVDGTGGQVVLTTRRIGSMAATPTVADALAAQAQSVLNLFDMVQTAQLLSGMTPLDPPGGIFPDGITNIVNPLLPDRPVYTTNDLWLEINGVTNSVTGQAVYLTIHRPWNDTNLFHDLYYSTDLSAPRQWNYAMRCPYTNAVVPDLTSSNGFFTLGPATNGNLTVSTNATALELARMLMPPWVWVTNATYTGALEARGTFTNGNACGLPINSGVILSSGHITNAVGPNRDDGGATSEYGDFGGNGFSVLGELGDRDLDKLVGDTTNNDAAVLEFDIFPTNSFSFQIPYIFASEEYPEWIAGSSGGFNDPMAIFVSTNMVAANRINSITNDIALVPGITNIPVSVNNINGGYTNNYYQIYLSPTNAQYYVDNDDPSHSAATNALAAAVFNIQYDGMTVLLTAQTNITANIGYHVKIGIEDYGDSSFDSAVFLKAWSP